MSTIMGQIYINQEMGQTSFHFDSDKIENSYISFANTPKDMTLDDKTKLPNKQKFHNPIYTDTE